MKIAHWVMFNTSGMFRVAESFAKVECMLGHESWLINFENEDDWKEAYDADIHVIHTHLPDKARMRFTNKKAKIVFFIHGTPEYVFTGSVINGTHDGYGFSDSFQLHQYWLKNADAIINHVPRHNKIWKSMVDKKTVVDLVPMGIEKDFWKPVNSWGKYMGEPSLFTAENCDFSKWPYDLFVCWPWIAEKIPTAHMHAVYLPSNLHRWFYPLINSNGCGYKCHTSGAIFTHEQIRNAFVSTDFFIGLVRYGDFNRLFMEASSTGAKTITYAGNEYADYWITEGDQRKIADELYNILIGKTKPRKNKLPVTDITDTGKAMIKIYERIA